MMRGVLQQLWEVEDWPQLDSRLLLGLRLTYQSSRSYSLREAYYSRSPLLQSINIQYQKRLERFKAFAYTYQRRPRQRM